LLVGGKGAGLTQLSGIAYRLKKWFTTATTINTGTALTPAPEDPGAQAAKATSATSTGAQFTAGTGGPTFQGGCTSGGASPGGWTAEDPDAAPTLEGSANQSSTVGRLGHGLDEVRVQRQARRVRGRHVDRLSRSLAPVAHSRRRECDNSRHDDEGAVVPAKTLIPTGFWVPGKIVKLTAFGKATTDGTAATMFSKWPTARATRRRRWLQARRSRNGIADQRHLEGGRLYECRSVGTAGFFRMWGEMRPAVALLASTLQPYIFPNATPADISIDTTSHERDHLPGAAFGRRRVDHGDDRASAGRSRSVSSSAARCRDG